MKEKKGYFEQMKSCQSLVEKYSTPKKRKGSFEIDERVKKWKKEHQQILKIILNDTYNNNFKILKKAFSEKMEIYLRLILDILREEECTELEIIDSIADVRWQISQMVTSRAPDERSGEWLENIGFARKDLAKILSEVGGMDLLKYLWDNQDRLQIVCGDWKTVLKIIKLSKGQQKLKRLLIFFSENEHCSVFFQAKQLVNVLRSSGWEEKLQYFEDEEKLRNLKEAGFNGYHLSQIVVNAGWEEKLQYFEDEEKLRKLKEAGFEASHLSQIVVNAGWEEKLQYFEDEEKLRNLKEAGFNGYHLSQIVVNAGWEEKLQYF
ncbi:MAG: hypothetical protein P1V18_00555, partial [Candidatus Gracilibacteria bacterium]|nr:hypothetical protein [Candidatus Gracilibacteria bacterium]